MQQNGNVGQFSSSDSWVILSPIEQTIKRKIESVGKPLKDWDIQINYGIKTGYNDAFIISTEKKDELLSNCKDTEERGRTAKLIRPILRGRDINRYQYNWANLWLIATFPSLHYDINEYPTLKEFLLSFGIERLEQTGKKHIINGEEIKARKKTSNKWFEVQDSIGYWDEFSKPKILWKRIGSILRFSYDESGKMGLDSTCFAVGNHVAYLCCVFNSRMGRYMLQDAPKTGTGDLLISVQAVEPLHVPDISDSENEKFKMLLNEAIENQGSTEIIRTIDDEIYELYGLEDDEKKYIDELSI